MTDNNNYNDRIDQLENLIGETEKITRSNRRAIETLAPDRAQRR